MGLDRDHETARGGDGKQERTEKKMGSPGEAILTSPDPGQIVTTVPESKGRSLLGTAGFVVTSWARHADA
jgi:hypothetical protein